MESNLSLIKQTLEISIRKICNLYDIAYSDLIMNEFLNNNNLLDGINKLIKNNNIFRTREFNSIFQFYIFRNIIYFFIRETKPEIVVETGVLHGLTSAWILQALEDNKKGKLISIDLPMRDWKKYMGSRPMGPGSEVEEDELSDQDPGWIVPNYLKPRWELILGPSEIHLKDICDKKGKVDLFVHDSDHSYENMKFECEYIKDNFPKANIVIDDFYHNHYTYELLAEDQYEGVLIDDLDSYGNIFPSTAFLKKK